VKVDPLEAEQREEQPALSQRDPALQAGRGRRVLLDERDRVHRDVGVAADLVRVAVVTGVLRVPPRVAHPDHAAGEEPREAVVAGAAHEDRAVCCLVRDERDLGEQDAQHRGDDELPPAVPEQDEPGAGAEERDGEPSAEDEVEPGSPLQQTLVARLRGDLEESLCQVRERDWGFGRRSDKGAWHWELELRWT
jgi:hypothetical protein